MKTDSIRDIIKHYEKRRKYMLETCNQGSIAAIPPLVMNLISFNCLRDYGIIQAPQQVDVILCFEHTKFSSVADIEQYAKCFGPKIKLPEHMIIVQVKFLHQNVYQNVGTIGYRAFTDRALVAECITEYIEDCFRAGLNVLATCSSGKYEILLILAQLSVNCDEHNLITFPIRGRRNIIHIFDPSWMIRKMRMMFYFYDVLYKCGDRNFFATYEHVTLLLNLDHIKHSVAREVRSEHLRNTKAAAKLFSHSMAIALRVGIGLIYDQMVYNNTSRKPDLPDIDGTKRFLQMFDELFDSLNSMSGNTKNGKVYRGPLTFTSEHWDLWSRMVPILQSMRFLTKSARFLKPPGPVELRRIGLDKPGLLIENAKIILTYDETIQYYSDDEYTNSTDYGHTEAQYSNAVTNLIIEGIIGTAELSDEDQARKNRMEKFRYQLKNILTMMSIAKKKSRFRSYIGKVENCVHTLLAFNAEMLLRRQTSVAYEYFSHQYSKMIHINTREFMESASYYEKIINTLNMTKDMMRFLNYTLFDCWLSAIEGMKSLFGKINKHCMSFTTRTVNCDSIHTFLELFRAENGLPNRNLVESGIYGNYNDYAMCILALSKDFNVTFTSSVLEEGEVYPESTVKEAGKRKHHFAGRKKKKHGKRRHFY